MKKTLKIIWKIFVRIFLGIISLILLLMIVFYLFRGKIKDKALTYVNEAQPGEVYLGKINLKPFMNFPAVSVQLKDIQYMAPSVDSLEQDTVPILQLEELYIALDVVQLIKGNYKVNKVRLGDGQINYTVGQDSISNIEEALGISFSASSTEVDTVQSDSSSLSLDMESLEIRNLILNYRDIPGDTYASITLNGLQSGFSYFPEQISASLRFHLDINSAAFKEIELDKPRTLAFGSSLIYDQVQKIVTLEHSMIDLQDAKIEMEADVWLEDHLVDMSFSASNSGIELLNFLLSGVLDMDAIEQIGDGEIALNGKVNGVYGEEIPDIEVDFHASDMGFNINAIGQAVTDIGFVGYARNGLAKDFSEAEVRLEDFHVSFPDGSLDVNVSMKNLVRPEVYVAIDGGADLSILKEIIKTDAVTNMQGKVAFGGELSGTIDKEKNQFLNEDDELIIKMTDVAVSLSDNEIQHLEGEIFVGGRDLGFRNLIAELDSTPVQLEGSIENILPALMSFPSKVQLNLSCVIDEILLHRFISDTLFEDPIKDLSFGVNASANWDALMNSLEDNEIPSANIRLENLKVNVPGYAPISEMDLNVQVNDKDLKIQKFNATIGESNIVFRANVKNYTAYLDKDSSQLLNASIEVSSGLLKASDLLTFEDEFMYLPQEFSIEEISGFRFKGNVETTVGELLKTSGLPNFKFDTDFFRWRLKHYPHAFKDFAIDVEKDDNLIYINKLKGTIGESNFLVKAEVADLLDSTKNFTGNLMIASDLLDFNALLDYDLLLNQEDDVQAENSEQSTEENTSADSSMDSEAKDPFSLYAFEYPDFELSLDVGELRYTGNTLFAIQGDVKSTEEKLIYLERFGLMSKSGGTIELNGLFDVSQEEVYTLTSTFDIDTLNMSDFDVQLAISDSIYSLEDNFNGTLSTEGIAEVFMKPDMTIDLDNSTAAFNLLLEDGRVKNFTPLQAASRLTGNKDLDNVKFGKLENRFSMVDGKIHMPIMAISTSLGVILIEGEQGFGADFLYLLRIPEKLVGSTAWNAIVNKKRKESAEEDEVMTDVSQTYYLITIFGDENGFDWKLGDKREKFKEQKD